MKILSAAVAGLLGLASAGAAVTPPAQNQGAYQTGVYRNLFVEAGRTPSEAAAKVNEAWTTYFTGSNARKVLLYKFNDDESFIQNVADKDVRSEGMSYGMMIAVQLDKPAEFDRLWRFAKRRMKQTSGDFAGYYCWRANTSGVCLDNGAAPDGEEYFAMALLFAANRWGVTTYRNDAHELLTAMLHKAPSGLVVPMFNLVEDQVVFAPIGEAATFTDPSYHLPAFYHLFSLWGPSADSSTWAAIRDKSRDYFHLARHPSTCLSPEYATFTGEPHFGYNVATNTFDQPAQKQSRNDAWRVPFNWAIDYAWFAADTREVGLVNCLLGFYGDPARGGGLTVTRGVYSANYWQYYNLDGSLNSPGLPNLDTSTGGTNYKAWGGLAGMHAASILAASSPNSTPLDFVRVLWSTSPPTGTYRYYDGLLYTLGVLATAGQYRIHLPPPAAVGTPREVNGGFDNQLANWQISVAPGAAASAAVTEGAARLAITSAGSSAQAVQLHQTLSVSAGRTYEVEFDARAIEGTSARAMTIALLAGAAPNAPLVQSSVTLSRTLTHFKISFPALGASDAQARLAFLVGSNADDLEIDNIVLLER